MTEALPSRSLGRGVSAQRRRRSRRVALHRARGLPGTLGITAMGAALPGSGFVFVGRRYLGLLILLPALLLGVVGTWFVATNVDAVIRFALDPSRLQVAASVMLVLLVAWVAVVVATYRMVRPVDQPRWQNVVGSAFVVGLCLLVAAPLAIGSRYSMVQADLVDTVFADDESATRPSGVTEADPWGGRDRVNVLLLGGDGGVDREGVRTDSMIVASMNVHTGRTVLFSLPRNLMYVPFPEDSPLADLYPYGFQGEGDEGEWMLNAVYRNVPALHPGVIGKSDNEGADALKLAVSGALGIDVDYYLLVNLAGFEQIVDAMGGVTVNINQPIPIGGNTDLGIPPEDYLEPGPNQRLDGFEALWYARGRYGLDDYNRMERQRCMMRAIIDEAEPLNLLRRYQALAAAGKEIVRTDIPQKLLPAFVELGMRVKDHEVESVVFRSSDEFSPGDPDYEWMHAQVDEVLAPPKRTPRGGGGGDAQSPKTTGGAAPGEEPTGDAASREERAGGDGAIAAATVASPADPCAYDPVE